MDEVLDCKSPIPLHAQLEKILRSNIENDIWTENCMIPSENELSRQYGLSRMTVRSVIQRLVQDELLYRVPGKGTFVNPNKIVSKPLHRMGVLEQMWNRGYYSTSKTIYAREGIADEDIAERLKLQPEEGVYELCRLRYVKQTPFSLHVSYIPKKLCPGMLEADHDFDGSQLCDILEQNYGIKRENVIETLEIVHADQDKAKLLEVKKNYPLLHLEDTIFGAGMIPMEYTSIFFRGDRIKLEIVNTYDEQ